MIESRYISIVRGSYARIILTICLFIVSSHFLLASSIKPTKLTVEYVDSPMGLDVALPRFGWIVEATDKNAFGQAQTAYRVQVSTSPTLLSEGKTDMWASEWILSNATQHIIYKGKSLASDRTYFWRIQVKDEKGQISEYSRTSSWSTGLLAENLWKGKWIGSDELYDKAAPDNNVNDPWLRKTFNLTSVPQKATFYVASVGYHEVYVNGKKVGNEVLAPIVTDHTKRARYVAYDLASYLKAGNNVIGLWLGASWSIYPPYILNVDRPLTPIVSGQVDFYHSKYPSATTKPTSSIITDGTWKIHASPNRLIGKWDFRNMGGEFFDARKAIKDWNAISYSDAHWKGVSVYQPRLKISGQRSEGNKKFDALTPVAIEARADGSYRVDMGRNFAGWTEVSVSGTEGDTIHFQYSEHETTDMTFNLRSAYVIDKTGKGAFRNRFNYSSGRWITIYGLKKAPTVQDIKGWMIRTDFKKAGSFTSSDTLQNWIYDHVKWTFENLALGGYIVDCPQRERMGYGGDAHATSETGMFNYQLGSFYTKWMQDWRDVQGTEPMVGNMLDPNWARKEMTSGRLLNNGALPHTAPTYWGGGGPAWGGIVVTLPWFLYQHYGDALVLKENVHLIENWLTFLESNSKDGMLQRFGGQWDFLGDWLWPNATAEGMNNDKPETLFLNNAYYVFNLRTASKIAATIGRKDLESKWTNLANRSEKAIHKKYFNASSNTYADGSMANLAAALLAEIPPKGIRPLVIKQLETEILVNRKGHIHAGITGGALLFKILRELGRDDLIYSMLSKTAYPSWGFMKENGATTIWEAWEKDLPGHSLLHSSYLYPGAWYIDGLGGIKRSQESVGFEQFVISPPAKTATTVNWVKVSFDSPKGLIQSNWSRESGKLQLSIVVPANSKAIVKVAENERLAVEAYTTIKELAKKEGFVHYEVLPGSYNLSQN